MRDTLPECACQRCERQVRYTEIEVVSLRRGILYHVCRACVAAWNGARKDAIDAVDEEWAQRVEATT